MINKTDAASEQRKLIVNLDELEPEHLCNYTYVIQNKTSSIEHDVLTCHQPPTVSLLAGDTGR